MGLFRSVAVVGMLGVIVLTTGCASVSNFQTAKPLGKGKTEAMLSGSFMQYTEEEKHFFGEAQARLGITEKLDVGVKYTLPAGASIDAKYCFLGAEKERGLFMSTGFQGGYTSFKINDDEYKRIDYYIPLYVSFFPIKFLSLSLIPSYSGRITFGGGYENLVGGNVNVRLGTKVGFVADWAFFRNFTTKGNEIQAGGGLFFPLLKSDK